MIQKCIGLNVLRSAHKKMDANACWWKMIESGWSSSVLKCAKIVKFFNPISKNIKLNVKLNSWKLIKYSTI